MMKRKMEHCAACGSLVPAGEYHPYAFCILAGVLGATSARENINAVLNHGRRLERLALPNDTPIRLVVEKDERRKASPPPRKRRKRT